MCNLRPVLDVEVRGGDGNAAKPGLARLRKLRDGLSPGERPVLVRGHIAFGNGRVMAAREAIGQRYLVKLKQTPGVKRKIERLWQQGEWQSFGQGLDTVEGELWLMGWNSERRVVVLRKRLKSSQAQIESGWSDKPPESPASPASCSYSPLRPGIRSRP